LTKILIDGILLYIEIMFGTIAQLGEHLPYKQGVTGSIPVGPTKYGEVLKWLKRLPC
jgi:hypothetical protein